MHDHVFGNDPVLGHLIQTANDAVDRMNQLAAVYTSPSSSAPSLVIGSCQLATPSSSTCQLATPSSSACRLDSRDSSVPSTRPTRSLSYPRTRNPSRLYRKCLENQARKRVLSQWYISDSDSVFFGTVHLQPRQAAMEFARTISQRKSSPEHVAFWAKAFLHPGEGFICSVATQFQGDQEWTHKLETAEDAHSSVHADFLSIKLAMEEAIGHVRRFPPPPGTSTCVRVFSDGRPALMRISNLPFIRAKGTLVAVGEVLHTLGLISQLSEELDRLNATLDLHWVAKDDMNDRKLKAPSAALPVRSSLEVVAPDVPARSSARGDGEAGPSNQNPVSEEEPAKNEDAEAGTSSFATALHKQRGKFSRWRSRWHRFLGRVRKRPAAS